MEPGSGREAGRVLRSSSEKSRFKDAAREGSEDRRRRLLDTGGGGLAMWSQEA